MPTETANASLAQAESPLEDITQAPHIDASSANSEVPPVDAYNDIEQDEGVISETNIPPVIKTQTDPEPERASVASPEIQRARLDISDLETLDGWEFFVNEAQMSNPARRCVANTHFKVDETNNVADSIGGIIEVPSAEMMYWDQGLIEEVQHAIADISGAACRLTLKEVTSVEGSVHQRQTTAKEQWRTQYTERLRQDPIVERAMAINGAEFKSDRIRFNDDE